jgi:hypothetical protein
MLLKRSDEEVDFGVRDRRVRDRKESSGDECTGDHSKNQQV